MIRIGICDDLKEDLERLKQMVFDIMIRLCQKAKIYCFESGENLLAEIEISGNMDIVLLDIKMKGKNGIETARAIRRQDFRTVLIFISLYDEYCKEAISVQPFYFLDKPVSFRSLADVIEYAVKTRIDSEEMYEFQSRQILYKLPLTEICYFESDRRKVYLHSVDHRYSFYKKLGDIEEELCQANVIFLRVQRSFLVNASYIREISYEKIVMQDGQEIRIGEKYRDAMNEYYIKRMENS